MPFYLYGSLQYFADVRAAYDKMISASEQSEGGSGSGHSSPPAGAAAASNVWGER